MVQWFGLCASTAEDMGLIPSQGTKKIPQATWHSKEKKKKLNVLKYTEHIFLIFKSYTIIPDISEFIAVVLNWGDFSPIQNFTRRKFPLGVSYRYLVGRGRSTTKHPSMHRTAPTTQNSEPKYQ